MGWPLEGTDQTEGPNPTQIDHRRPPRVAEGHLQCLLHDPRFRKAASAAKRRALFDPPGETGKLREMREVTPTVIVECIPGAG